MDPTMIMLSMLFGSIGMGMFIFGKKQGRPVPLFAGLLLMVIPYIIPNTIAMSCVAVLLTVAPFFIAI